AVGTTVTLPGPSVTMQGQNHTTASIPDLTVQGDLILNQALLYVKGNLTVQGGLTGSGIVVVLGSTTVTGATDVAAGNLVALVAMGNVTLIGNAGVKNYFQGLVYTRGTFSASNVTIAGTFVTGGALSLGP